MSVLDLNGAKIVTSILDYVKTCIFCEGTGSRVQTYNAGCGQGYYKASGPCDFCEETGFIYNSTGNAVPKSVVHQINNTIRNFNG